MKTIRASMLGSFACGLLLACSSSPEQAAVFDANTQQFEVSVPETGRVYLKLSPPSLVIPSDPANSPEWDLAFENFDVYTNSGPSGAGQAAAFGQVDISAFGDDAAPAVPFLSPDKAGGAFANWYAYDGQNHALYSRHHVYGVKNGERLWKAQILSYYSEQDNAPVSGLYQIRYAELGDEVGDTHTLQIDGTAGGLSGSASSGSGCLDLASAAVRQITPEKARASQDWDLCFRRDSISVNGEAGGPRGVGAVDLQADQTSTEELAAIVEQSADSALVRFSDVSRASLASATFRGDHVVSAFETGVWLHAEASPIAPARAAWLVREASGERQSLLAFSEFREPTASSPGTVVVHIKPVKR
jgi:hypothetical protein